MGKLFVVWKRSVQDLSMTPAKTRVSIIGSLFLHSTQQTTTSFCVLATSGALREGDGSSRRRFVSLEQLPDGMLRFAEEIVRHFDDKFGRGSVARVDLFDQRGTPTLCELECVEPNTNLAIVAKAHKDKANEALRRYADVIERRTKEILDAKKLRPNKAVNRSGDSSGN